MWHTLVSCSLEIMATEVRYNYCLIRNEFSQSKLVLNSIICIFVCIFYVFSSNLLILSCYASGVWHQNILGIWSKLVAKVFTVYGLLVTCKYTEKLQHIGPKYSETLEKLQLLHRKFFYPNNLKRNFFPLRCKELSKVV